MQLRSQYVEGFLDLEAERTVMRVYMSIEEGDALSEEYVSWKMCNVNIETFLCIELFSGISSLIERIHILHGV